MNSSIAKLHESSVAIHALCMHKDKADDDGDQSVLAEAIERFVRRCSRFSLLAAHCHLNRNFASMSDTINSQLLQLQNAVQGTLTNYRPTIGSLLAHMQGNAAPAEASTAAATTLVPLIIAYYGLLAARY